MAHVENRGSGAPDPFVNLMTGLFGADTAETARLQALGNSLQELGFIGPLAEKISAWKKRGIGKEIVIPVAQSDPRGTGDKPKFRSMIFALPLTDDSVKGHDKRMLLLFPTAESYDVQVVGPRASERKKSIEQESENESFLSDYTLMFEHQGPTTVHPSWRPKPEEIVIDSFTGNLELFPVTIDGSNDKGSYELIAEAEAAAERIRVNRLKTDDYTLKDTIDPSVAAAIEDVGRNWDLFIVDTTATLFDSTDTETP